MPRWEPNVRDRLSAAALTLFESRDYHEVTVAEIAAEAGVTSRTFFRQFPEKREVLFDGASRVHARIIGTLREVPLDVAPFEAVVRAMGAVGDLVTDEDRGWMQRRQGIVRRTPELEERESMKRAMIARDVAATLIERGTDPGAAALVADLGIAILNRAGALWADREPGTYVELNHRATAEIIHATHHVEL